MEFAGPDAWAPHRTVVGGIDGSDIESWCRPRRRRASRVRISFRPMRRCGQPRWRLADQSGWSCGPHRQHPQHLRPSTAQSL